MTAPTRMTAVMDQLVSGARASRDGVVNTLDAVERKSRAANASLAQQVAKICADHPKQPARATADPPQLIVDERDTRFDPEDEWDVAGPSTSAIISGAAASNTPVGNRAAADDDDDDGDGYPTTWLR
jgi:hypothetical protein